MGKRYYPHKEDFEQNKELEVLRALAPDDPERTVVLDEATPALHGTQHRYDVRQPTGKGSIGTGVCADNLDEARIKAKVALPFRPTWIPTTWKPIDKGGKAIPPSPTRVLTIHLMRSIYYVGVRFAVRNAVDSVLGVDGTWTTEPLSSQRDAEFFERCCFPDFVSAMRAADKARKDR